MSQGPLCPNLSQKVQKEVSQMANCNLSPVILLGGLSVNLNHLETRAQIEREELADKIINFTKKEDHPVDLELAALSSKIKGKLPDPDDQDNLLDEIKDLAQSYFQRKHRNITTPPTTTSTVIPTPGGATAVIVTQMPPPLCKDWDRSNNKKVEEMY